MRSLVGLFTIFMVVLGFAVPASATILTFYDYYGSHGGSMPDDYGDNVTTTTNGYNGRYGYERGNGWTPNVGLTYDPESSINKVAWRDNSTYAGWKDTDGASMPYAPVGQTVTYTFTPAEGYSVDINSWLMGDLGGTGDGDSIIYWSIYGGSVDAANLLAAGTNTFAQESPDVATTEVITPNIAPYPGTLILAITSGGGDFWDRVIDDINFDERAIRIGDFDGDDKCDGSDYFVWMTNYPMASGAAAANGDADNDGDVDETDFLIWQYKYPTNYED